MSAEDPVPPSPPHPLGRDDFAALVEAVVAAVRSTVTEAVGKGVPQLLDQPAAMEYAGLSRSGWFRAKSAGLLPKPVHVEGSGEKWRKRDLDEWIARMKPVRRRSRRGESDQGEPGPDEPTA